MWNQIRVKEEYFKKYTTCKNQATRYSNATVYKNYERLFYEDSCCHVEFSRWMVEMICIQDSIDDKVIIMRTIMIKLIYIQKYVFESYTKMIQT